MHAHAKQLIEAEAGAAPVSLRPLSGGCIGEVWHVTLTDGRDLVAKIGGAGSGLALEGFMLSYLAEKSDLPVPALIHASDHILLMDFIPSGDALSPGAERHAAELLAALHAITADGYGFERNTLIGGLVQPNPWDNDWIAFFRDQRLIHMARAALAARRLSLKTMTRLEALAGKLATWLAPAGPPSLIHGDMWGGNVLCKGGRIAALVDPAIYYGDAEIELAFSTLFSTFGEAFFKRYGEIRPLRQGFFEERRDIYNLYPLLVHARLFGGSYAQSVETVLTRFGF